MTPRGGAPMTFGAIRLVASREIKLRIRSRAFVISTLVLMAAVAGMVVLAAVLRDEGRRELRVGVVDATPALQRALVANGDALDTDVTVVHLDDEAAAERAVREDDVDVALVGDTVIWEQDTNDVDEAIVKGAAQSAAIAARAADAGLDSQQLAELLRPPPLEDRVLEPRDSDRGVRIATASIGVVLLFLAIQTYGNMVLMGVIEEKSSRVVEVLLNHLRPRALLAGKILGIGALGLLQMVLVLLSALVALASVRGVDVPEIPVDGLIWFVVWFLLGFAFYATAFAMGGSLVSRQEDAASVITPISIPFIASYLASFAIAGNPGSTFAKVLSLVPVTAPMTMPARIAAGEPSVVEIAASVLLTVAATYVLVVVAGRVYARNVLRTGARVSWKSALRAARTAEG
jgi:ABC-2 type transport system permease protein